MMNQRDIDALREGIRIQERETLLKEQSDKSWRDISAREYVKTDTMALIDPALIFEGDRLIATETGYAFFVSGTVTSIKQRKNGDYWMAFELTNGSYGGHAVGADEHVLIAGREA